jgi:transcriptional regulator with XRE-family HTH domain
MIICWTRKEMAEYLGVTPEYVRRIWLWRQKLSKKKLALLFNFYDEKMAEIMKTNKAIKKITDSI